LSEKAECGMAGREAFESIWRTNHLKLEGFWCAGRASGCSSELGDVVSVVDVLVPRVALELEVPVPLKALGLEMPVPNEALGLEMPVPNVALGLEKSGDEG
jgi:hypothetical protein